MGGYRVRRKEPEGRVQTQPVPNRIETSARRFLKDAGLFHFFWGKLKSFSAFRPAFFVSRSGPFTATSAIARR
jgi:hypothetical protein